MDFEDQVLTCADCQTSFTFTAGEQQFFEQKGFTSPPKRCKACRELRRRDRTSGAAPPGRGTEPAEYRSPAFRDSDPSRGRGGGHGPGRGTARPRRGPATTTPDAVGEYRAPSFSPRPAPSPYLPGTEEEIDEVADSIGNQLHPPARPGGAPVPSVRGDGPPPGERREGGGGAHRGRPRAMHEITCAECGKTSRVPFKPQSGKPVFCRECYQLKKDGQKEEAVG